MAVASFARGDAHSRAVVGHLRPLAATTRPSIADRVGQGFATRWRFQTSLLVSTAMTRGCRDRRARRDDHESRSPCSSRPRRAPMLPGCLWRRTMTTLMCSRVACAPRADVIRARSVNQRLPQAWMARRFRGWARRAQRLCLSRSRRERLEQRFALGVQPVARTRGGARITQAGAISVSLWLRTLGDIAIARS